MRRLLLTICSLISLSLPSPAQDAAQEPAPPAPTITPSMFVGALETVGLKDGVHHLGVYATLGFSLNIPLSPTWSLIPSLGLEFAPEFGDWGGTLFLTAERLLSEGATLLLLDLFVGVVHDAVPDGSGDFSHHAFPGAGVGLAIVLGKITLAPSVALYIGSDGEGLALTPTLLASVPF
jgi:hypothetical protein